MRETEPVNGAVQADERRCPHISDDAVVFDGLISHQPTLSLVSTSVEILKRKDKDIR